MLSGLTAQAADFGDEFHDVWPNIPKDGMRGLQTEIELLFQSEQERISVVLLEAPMGEGKTEAGIFAAIQMAKQWGKCGFYIGVAHSCHLQSDGWTYADVIEAAPTSKLGPSAP